MLKKKILLTAGAASVSLCASPAWADTLEEALARAYENNPQVELSRAIARADDEGITQARAAYGPTIGIDVNHTFTYSKNRITSNFVSTIDGFATTANVVATQPIFTSGFLSSNMDRARATSASSRESLRGTSQQLILDVITSYASLQRDIELYQISVDIYRLLADQSDLTQRRLNLRDATAPDVDQTRNREQLAAARVVQARGNLEVSASAYRNLVGAYPDTLAPPPSLPALDDLELLYANANNRNPELRAAQYNEVVSRADVAASRAARGPQITGEVVAGRLPGTPYTNTNFSKQVAAGIRLTMPLYTGGDLASRTREALQRNLAAQQNVEQTRRGVRQSLANNWNQMRAAEQSLPLLKSAVEAAQRAVSGVKDQERAGIRTLRDVLDVTNDLFQARSNEVSAEAELYIRHAAVLRDAGVLTVDLFVDGPQYDPDSYRPIEAGLAGLPFGQLVEPLDSLVVMDGVRNAGVEEENDLEYESGEALINPIP